MKITKIRFKSFGGFSRPYDYLLIGAAKSGGRAKLRIGAGKYDYKEIVVCGVEDVGADLPTHVTKALRFKDPGICSVEPIPWSVTERAKKKKVAEKKKRSELSVYGRKWSSLTPAQQKVWAPANLNPAVAMKRRLSWQEVAEGALL